MLFGKLFGCLAIIRSGRLLTTTSEQNLAILERLLQLLKKKIWIREVVSEAVLVYLDHLPVGSSPSTVPLAEIAEKLAPFISHCSVDSIHDMSAYEVILANGVQHFAVRNKAVGADKIFAKAGFSTHHSFFSAKSLPALAPILTAACAGFPKVCLLVSYCICVILSADSPCLALSAHSHFRRTI